MSFKNITSEEYNRLIKNKNRIFDLTFPTPERLNKYRDDKDIYEDIRYSEKQNKQIKDYNKVLNRNLNKYLIKNDHQEKLIKTAKYFDKLFENASEEELKNREMLVNLSEKNKYKFETDEDIIKSFKKYLEKNKYHINLTKINSIQ